MTGVVEYSIGSALKSNGHKKETYIYFQPTLGVMFYWWI